MATTPSVSPRSQPKKPVAAALSAWSPESVLQSVLTQNPGFSGAYNPSNVQIVIADPSRRAAAEKYNAGSGLEFWPSSEMGSALFPRPSNTSGKSVLEIYSPELARDPTQLRAAIYGDLLHGMSSDPYWNSLRTQFMRSFTPQELKRQQQRRTWWEDVNNSKGAAFGPTYDAYIRGWLTPGSAEHASAVQGQTQSGNTMYSPAQMKILQKMAEYLKSGKREQ